jgi:phosphoribosyl-ATP pyrophosphohydrolase/phosphoribosyl-AMP cyclohydrolase
MRRADDTALRFGEDGLIPAIVQDARTRRVLMLGYMDTEALEATRSTGLVHFHSRSRDELWKKGETSGNTLAVDSISADCDSDALLILAEPTGPTCHTGATSCWDSEPSDREPGFADLEALWATISSRAAKRPAGSYTTTLLDDPDLAVRKVTEEATEVLMAARDHRRDEATDERLAEEMADLVYHLLVVAAERGISPALVLDELSNRRR